MSVLHVLSNEIVIQIRTSCPSLKELGLISWLNYFCDHVALEEMTSLEALTEFELHICSLIVTRFGTGQSVIIGKCHCSHACLL